MLVSSIPAISWKGLGCGVSWREWWAVGAAGRPCMIDMVILLCIRANCEVTVGVGQGKATKLLAALE